MSDEQLNSVFKQLVADEQALSESVSLVLQASDYLQQWGERYPNRAAELVNSGDLQRVYQAGYIEALLSTYLHAVEDEPSLHQQLRLFRQREMVRIIWRDIAGWADLAETVRDLSAMADACVTQSLDLLHQWQVKELGAPCDANGNEQQLIVLGMGKLGAGELNLSSDIDLIFTYPEDGETQGGRRSLSNGEFFTRLGRKLIQSLDNVTVDGFVFRVDMRLRPFGESGALAASFDAMEDYYQTQGREWERYAMIKARPITGSDVGKNAIMALLRPFVYRRYLDYGVFDALREMKSMIAAQLHRKGMEDNIKLGAGGIREIEFIGQVFQLINGGREPILQQRPILTILDLLAEREILLDRVVNDLKLAYDFLRRTEHRIQAWQDKQTHLLPTDSQAQQRIARLMGFDDWFSFSVELAKHRDKVQSHFEQVLIAPQADGTEADGAILFCLDDEEKINFLESIGFENSAKSLLLINGLLDTHDFKNMDDAGRKRLKTLLPLLIQATTQAQQPEQTLARLVPLLEAIMRRSAYISLLVENPQALSQLVKLCAASPWISHQLARHPVLLDELLDPRSLYDVPNRQQLQRLLNQSLVQVHDTDLERQMDLLREFKQACLLNVAVADISDVLHVMRVGDQLTDLAEIQLSKVMSLAWDYLVERHGRPPSTDNDSLEQCGFCVLGYGKLGGLELGYGSDLDLVFIVDDDTNKGLTDGDKPIDSLMFYIRLAQRIIHLLNTVTSSGILYEVDMRLRPNGNSGLLVASLSGFEQYQREDAWTWEHQALVRARTVAGDSHLAEKFSQIRQQILVKQRDQQALVAEVQDMRAKMRNNLDKSTSQLFDLKQGLGGITDIEFIAQYAVLAWSKAYPQLHTYTDTIRVLEALKITDKLSSEQCENLADAYRFYRSLANHCVLQELPAVVPMDDVVEYQPHVVAIWQQVLG